MGKIARQIKNIISDNCSYKLPKCFTTTNLHFIKQYLQSRIGRRRYQIEKMVETITSGGVGADSSCSFATKVVNCILTSMTVTIMTNTILDIRGLVLYLWLLYVE